MESLEKLLSRFDKLQKTVDYLVHQVTNLVTDFDKPGKDTYTEKEASEKLKLTVRTLISHRKEGKIDFHQNGRRVIYTEQNINDFLMHGKKKGYRMK